MKFVEKGFKFWIETLEYVREADENLGILFVGTKEGGRKKGFPFSFFYFFSYLLGGWYLYKYIALNSCLGDFTILHSSLSLP